LSKREVVTELEATAKGQEEGGNREMIKEQEYNHMMDLEITELFAPVKVEFSDPRILEERHT
jgi:hypothetical protein